VPSTLVGRYILDVEIGSQLDSRARRRGAADAAVPLSVCLLLVGATVTWRAKVYYEGGVDTVVVLKALLTVLALAVAWQAYRRCREPRPLGARTMWFLAAFLAVSTFGAWSTGEVEASAVLSVRALLLALTVVLLIRAFPSDVVLKSLLTATGTFGVLAAITGFGSYASGERLQGTMPPLNPNEIAVLCALPAVGLGWLALTHRSQGIHGALMAGLLAVIWATGSRTVLFALLVALFVMALQSRRLGPVIACTLVFVFFAFVYVATATSVLTGYFARGGDENVATLNSRTIAWSAALSFPETEWVRWMGAGLATKLVPVQGQYWDQQLLDSSWISALVQAGLIGALILLLWALCTCWASLRVPAPTRMLYSALVVFLLIRSVLESGLVDSTPSFVTFFLVSMLADRRTSRVDVSGVRTVPSVPRRSASPRFAGSVGP